VPVGRLGEPEEIAAAVAFALSAGSDFLAGRHFSVGGGVTMV
jgi:NAD(P)-dependent dehydrogenase (short-subunit alcohol dehydrogenase family)